ncbi:E3 ubiquitin-protein ligase TRIM71-like [Mytilus edulis]|uniref:E3 ubiquitin-protein ligase TRIM71-like n=1 Tax=Mytilus edulis TaxID=6550 RepID=UPI0039EFC881
MAKSYRCISSLIECPPVCNLCETSVSVHSRCLECQEFLCENCRKVHSKGKATKSHKIIQIYGNRDALPFTKFIKCTDHEKSDVIMYCQNCESLVCSECIAITHSGHLFQQIDSVYNVKVEELEMRLAGIENDSLKEISLHIKRTKFKKRHKKSEIEFLKERIIQLTEVQKKVLEKRRDCILNDLDDHFNTSEKILNETEMDLNLIKTELKDCQQIIYKSLSSCERIGVIRSANSTKEKLDKIDVSKGVPAIESPSFEKSDLDADICLGVVSFSLNMNGGDTVSETTNGVKVETSVAGVLDTDYRFISSVCQLSGGYSWTGSSSGDTIMLVHHNDDLQKVSELNVTADDMAHLAADNILVTCPDDPIIQTVSTIDGSSQTFLDVSPLYPTGIHINGNKDILVSMVEGHRYSFKVDSQRKVVRYSSDKNIKSEYQFAGTKRLFTYPYKLCENTNSDVCVVDKSGAFTGRLVMLDQSGSLRFTYNGTSSMDQKSTFDPRDVVCDSLGRVIISDCGNHTLHILDHDGDIICHINTIKLGIKYPWSLSLESYVKLWIGCKAEPEKSDTAKLYVIETDIDQMCII